LFVVAVIQCIARKILSGKCVAAFYLANNVVAAASHALTAGLDVTQSDERIKSFGDSENTGHQRHRVKNAATLTADATGNKGRDTRADIVGRHGDPTAVNEIELKGEYFVVATCHCKIYVMLELHCILYCLVLRSVVKCCLFRV